MKEIKWLISHLIIAAYTSSWWACSKFGWFIGKEEFPLFIIPFLFTMGLGAFFIAYMAEHWNDK